MSLQDALDTLKNPLVAGAAGAVLGAGLGAGAVGLVSSRKKKRSKRRSRARSKSRTKRRGKHKHRSSPRGKFSRHTHRKVKNRKGIHYTKKGQPYKILASGKARFIKKKKR